MKDYFIFTNDTPIKISEQNGQIRVTFWDTTVSSVSVSPDKLTEQLRDLIKYIEKYGPQVKKT